MKDEEIRILTLQLQRQAIKGIKFSLPEQGTPYIRFVYEGRSISDFKRISLTENKISEVINKAKNVGKLSMLSTNLVVQDCATDDKKCMEVVVYCEATSEYQKDDLTKARDQLHNLLAGSNGVLKASSRVELLFKKADGMNAAISNEAHQRVIAELKKLKVEIEELKQQNADFQKSNEALRIENDKLKINVEHTDNLYSDSLFRIKELEEELDKREFNVTELRTAIVRASTVHQDSITLLQSMSLELPEFLEEDEAQGSPSVRRQSEGSQFGSTVSLGIPRPSVRKNSKVKLMLRSLRSSISEEPTPGPSENIDNFEISTSAPRRRSTVHSYRQSIREVLRMSISPADINVQLKTKADLRQDLDMVLLELKNIRGFYMDAKNFEEIERNNFFFDESFKVVSNLTGQFAGQIGVALREIDELQRETEELEEKIATLQRANEQYENELSAMRDTIKTMGAEQVVRHTNFEDEGELHASTRRSVPFVPVLQEESDNLELKQNSLDLLATGSEEYEIKIIEESPDERSAMAKLIYQQQLVLKGDIKKMDTKLDGYSSEDEKEETTGNQKFVSDKAPIEWSVAEVVEFLNFIEDGQLQKFIPEFRRTLVTGEVLLSLQRTELKHEYKMSRKEITALIKSLFLVDPNFKSRMIKKYKRKRKRLKTANNYRMVMSTFDWDSFIKKQNKKVVDCCVGELVRLTDGREGRVLFKGPTFFSDGVWLGVELLKGEGRHDGMVKGKRYFQAHGSKCGIFVRRQKVKEKLDIQVYQPLHLNRLAWSSDLASARSSLSSRITVEGDIHQINQETFDEATFDDIEMNEEKSAREEEWYLSTGTEGEE